MTRKENKPFFLQKDIKEVMVCGPNQGSVPNNRLHQINPGVCSCFLLFLINYHPTTTAPTPQHHNSTNTTTPTPHCCFHQRSGVSAQSPIAHSFTQFYPAVGPLKLCNTLFHLKITPNYVVTQKAALSVVHIAYFTTTQGRFCYPVSLHCENV